jgi:hypothetical protein
VLAKRYQRDLAASLCPTLIVTVCCTRLHTDGQSSWTRE